MPDCLAALQAACAEGGTTLVAAGLNPGFAAEQMAVVATGVCTELDCIEVVESVDCRAVRNPDYVFRILGFGEDSDQVDANDPTWGPAASLNGMYAEVLSAMAEHLCLPLDRIDTDHRVMGATHDLAIAAGAIACGGISHVNWRWRGMVGETAKLIMSIHWYMELAHLAEPEPPLWRIHVEGQPGVKLTIDLDKRAGDTSATSAEQLGVAGTVINTIPWLCAAPPGVMTRPLATPFRGAWT